MEEAARFRELEQPVSTRPSLAKLGIFESFFNAVSGVPDLEYALIDGAIVQVRHTATGAKGGLNVRPYDAHVAA